MFVSGKLDTDVMILGDLPSADDDRTGEAFSGQAGVLLDRMLAAINLKRADFAVTTAIPWRPPGNRAPTTQELAVCLPFFRRQIELVRPRVVLIFGTLPVQMLIGGSASNLKARGHTHRFVLDGVEMDAMVTLSPAHLLKHPAQKKFAWQDLQIFQRMM